MPSSNTCRFTALSMALTATTTSVAVIAASAGNGGSGLLAFRGALGVKPHGLGQHRLDVGVARARVRLSR